MNEQKKLRDAMVVIQGQLRLLQLEKRLKESGFIDDDDTLLSATPPIQVPGGPITQGWSAFGPGTKFDKDGKPDPASLKFGGSVIIPFNFRLGSGLTGLPIDGGLGIGIGGTIPLDGSKLSGAIGPTIGIRY